MTRLGLVSEKCRRGTGVNPYSAQEALAPRQFCLGGTANTPHGFPNEHSLPAKERQRRRGTVFRDSNGGRNSRLPNGRGPTRQPSLVRIERRLVVWHPDQFI